MGKSNRTSKRRFWNRCSLWNRRSLWIALILAFGLPLGCQMMMPSELKQASAAAKRLELAQPDALGMRAELHVFQTTPHSAGTKSTTSIEPLTTIVMIHGSPGDWGAYAPFLEDPSWTNTFRIIAPDRPGFGKSQAAGTEVPSLKNQAARLAALTQDLSGKKIWIGHSFGATVVGQVAIDYPDQVDGLLLIAGAYAPELEQPRWFNRLASAGEKVGVVRGGLKRSNQEIYAYADQLDYMDWSKVICPTVILHGRNDNLASPNNVDWLESRLHGSEVQLDWVQDGGHLILWTHPQRVRAALDRLLE